MRGQGKLREPLEVGVALFEEGVLALLRFLHEVVHQGGVPGELHQSSLSIELGVEAALDHAEGQRRALHDGLAPLDVGFLELAPRGTTVLTKPMASASAAEYCSQRNQISRAFFLAHMAGEVAGAKTSIKASNLGAGLSKNGVF